jgi:hypothetical protein
MLTEFSLENLKLLRKVLLEPAIFWMNVLTGAFRNEPTNYELSNPDLACFSASFMQTVNHLGDTDVGFEAGGPFGMVKFLNRKENVIIGI